MQTQASSALGITFSDGTTFNLKANAEITIDNFVYEDGGKKNAGVFDVAKGTVAFVAAQVAKTGDMQITTPTATLGIRGTSGLVEVPAAGTAAAADANNVNIKLYPDADGRVGRIEVNDRAGARLGFLTQGASGFAIRPGTGRCALCRRADHHLAADDAARPGFCPPGPLDANARPPRVRRTARLPPRQSRTSSIRTGRSASPGNPAGPVSCAPANYVPAKSKPSRSTAAAGLAEPAGSAATGRAGSPRAARRSNRRCRARRSNPASGRNRVSPDNPASSTGSRASSRVRNSPACAPRPGQPAGAPAQGGVARRRARTGRTCRTRAGESAAAPATAGRIRAPGGAQPLPQQGGQLQRPPGAPGLQRPGLAGRPGLQLPRRPAPAAGQKGKKPPAVPR